jgi:lysophospholipase L1-like esterase
MTRETSTAMRAVKRSKHAGALIVALQIMGLSACAQEKTASTDPAPGGEIWMTVHRAFLKQAEERKPVELLFLGDSITQGWHATGTETWERFYVPRHVLNFGIGGDRTEQVLWRLDHGEVANLAPKVVVLLIGTNNVGRNTNEEVSEGVKAVVGRLRSKLPKSKILLLGLFPRGQSDDPTPTEMAVDSRLASINKIVAKLDDGKMIKFLDIGKAFLNGDGQIPRSVMPDFLHLSRTGYRIWADAMEPTLWEMMEGK